ncbi:MAG: hypothetical protein JNM56_04365 [Planctomycetia bacterium]|nr:hypothetical protein [Planctomycetia bacterium]
MSTIATRFLTSMNSDLRQTTSALMPFLTPTAEQDVSWLWTEAMFLAVVEAWLVNDKKTNVRGLTALEDLLPDFLWKRTRTMIRAKASNKRGFLPRKGGAATVAATLFLHIYLLSVCVRLAVDLQEQMVASTKRFFGL